MTPVRNGVTVGQRGVRWRVGRIDPDSLPQVLDSLLEPLFRPLDAEEPALQIGFVSLGIETTVAGQARLLLRGERDPNLACDVPRHGALQDQDIAQIALV